MVQFIDPMFVFFVIGLAICALLWRIERHLRLLVNDIVERDARAFSQ